MQPETPARPRLSALVKTAAVPRRKRTRWCGLLAVRVVAGVAAAWPSWKMSHIDIVHGLRHVA